MPGLKTNRKPVVGFNNKNCQLNAGRDIKTENFLMKLLLLLIYLMTVLDD